MQRGLEQIGFLAYPCFETVHAELLVIRRKFGGFLADNHAHNEGTAQIGLWETGVHISSYIKTGHVGCTILIPEDTGKPVPAAGTDWFIHRKLNGMFVMIVLVPPLVEHASRRPFVPELNLFDDADHVFF